LAGTLTLPAVEGQHPAVVLMTGTGPQDRNNVVIPRFHLFQQIANYLTQQGIAVLRYDDRGVAASGGVFEEASIYDFASDAAAAIAYLESRADINPNQTGVLGHSEGGVYAAILGADPDSSVDFIVTMAGPGVNGSDTLREQSRLLFEAEGASKALIASQLAFLDDVIPLMIAEDYEAASERTRDVALEQLEIAREAGDPAVAQIRDDDTYAQTIVDSFMTSYANASFSSLMAYDPRPDFVKTAVPILAIFGELDLQVPPALNTAALEATFADSDNDDVTIVTIPTANHLFQAANTGTATEYTRLKRTFTEAFLPTLGDWILERVNVVE
ncbi:MAG: alpha/beta fold hydrolase, partial [Chloroflexota bacterium]